MTDQEYQILVAEVKAKHLARCGNDEACKVFYEAMDEEYVASGQPTQAEHEANVIVQLMELAVK